MKNSEYIRQTKALYRKQGYLIVAWKGKKIIGTIEPLNKIPCVYIKIEARSSRREFESQPGIKITSPDYKNAHFYRCLVLD